MKIWPPRLFPPILDKFGDIINILKSLRDFKMFCFSPVSGSYVKGFGKAYTIEGGALDQISHVNFSTNQKMWNKFADKQYFLK